MGTKKMKKARKRRKMLINPLYWEGRFIARQDNVEEKTVTEVH